MSRRKKDKSHLIHLGQRLKAARKMAGMSMEELVTRAGRIVSKQSVSKYENGLMEPSPQILARLAQVLGVKPSYFYQRTRLQLTNLYFRQKSKLSRKEEAAIKYKAIDYLERYLDLEDKLGLHLSFKYRLKKKPLENINDIEELVMKIRHDWGLGQAPIVNLLGLLEEKGIKVFLTPASGKFAGLTAQNGQAHVIVVNSNHPLDRVRFTASHELGHIICAFPEDVEDEESLCHVFAGAFLLPGKVLKSLLGQRRHKITLWEWQHIKETYGISMQAAIHRAYECGIISQNYFRVLIHQLRQRGWHRVEPFTYQGKEEASRFKRLLAFALAEDLLTPAEAKRIGGEELPQPLEITA
mgnify:CR=1 FL=1|jgi:Zn-dependent peptidase ImmA (M78 family)/DNA-binding XRE family transcriptional regulator